MMGLCYNWSLVTVRIFILIGVIMHFQVALFFFTLVGIVVSAPVSQKLNSMDMETIEQAHSLISKTLKDIPTTRAAWINSKTLTWGNSTDKLQFFKSKIPSAPALPNITGISSMETCLDKITEGLQLHLNFLKELVKASTLSQTELQADIEELLKLIKKQQTQAVFEPSKQTSEEQSQSLEAKDLTSDFKTQAAAYLILEQLQDFINEVLQRILIIRSMKSADY